MYNAMPYGYEDVEKMYKGSAPDWFWNLTEIEMDFGDGEKIATYLCSIGKEVRYNPNDEIWYIPKERFWSDAYFYNYPYSHESEHDKVLPNTKNTINNKIATANKKMNAKEISHQEIACIERDR